MTIETSLASITPEVFTSNLKLVALVRSPDRTFTALMSLELTERELLTSPNRKPIDADALVVPLTPLSDTVNRCISLTLVNVTEISLPVCCAFALIVTPFESTADAAR